MKKLFTVFLCGISMIGNSQIVLKPAIGLNVTDISKDPSSGNFKSEVGWQIGGSAVFGKKFYVEPGVFWQQKSSKLEDLTNVSEDTKFDLKGIRIPVSVGYKLINDEKGLLGLRIFGGGSAFILTAVSEGDKSDYKSTAWGLFAGAGVDISLVFLDLSYEWSLTDVADDLSSAEIGKSRSLFVNAGIRIPL
jgi:Outer membrane protein beta-barrel domain